MKKKTSQNGFDPRKNYHQTQKEIGYVSRKKAKKSDYERIGFKSGLEVHQQLKTKQKLFCRCPAGLYHDHNDYDAEIIRHMRPTLSEMGEYDGTALMEFKTRKNIFYRLNEINEMDKTALKFSEKKELRKEVRSIKNELKETPGGIYISVGAAIIIILLLIILL